MPAPEIDYFFNWRETERNKRRIMTWAEYQAWCRGSGDGISSSAEANPFPGGLTIIFGREASYIGHTSNE